MLKALLYHYVGIIGDKKLHKIKPAARPSHTCLQLLSFNKEKCSGTHLKQPQIKAKGAAGRQTKDTGATKRRRWRCQIGRI